MTDKQIKATCLPGDFIFHEQWLEIFKSFAPEMAGRLLHAVINYLLTGAQPEDKELQLMCTFLFAHIDVDRAHIAALQPASRRRAKKAEKPTDNTPSDNTPTDTPSDTNLNDTKAGDSTTNSEPQTPPQHNAKPKPSSYYRSVSNDDDERPRFSMGVHPDSPFLNMS